jgi:hypothetical protein
MYYLTLQYLFCTRKYHNIKVQAVSNHYSILSHKYCVKFITYMNNNDNANSFTKILKVVNKVLLLQTFNVEYYNVFIVSK